MWPSPSYFLGVTLAPETSNSCSQHNCHPLLCPHPSRQCRLNPSQVFSGTAKLLMRRLMQGEVVDSLGLGTLTPGCRLEEHHIRATGCYGVFGDYGTVHHCPLQQGVAASARGQCHLLVSLLFLILFQSIVTSLLSLPNMHPGTCWLLSRSRGSCFSFTSPSIPSQERTWTSSSQEQLFTQQLIIRQL